jgi:nucleoid DNA-binding protein
MPRKNKFATNKDVAKAVRRKLKLPEALTRQVIDRYFEEIKKALLSGDRVNLKGFGSFEMIKWKTDEYYSINEKKKIKKELKTVSFKTSQHLKRHID